MTTCLASASRTALPHDPTVLTFRSSGAATLPEPIATRKGVRSGATIYVGSRPGIAHVGIGPLPDCLFCRIVSCEVPALSVLESDRTLAFRDINPQAPTHVLVIPKSHYPDLASLSATDDGLLAEVVEQAHKVAVAEGIDG